MTVKSLNTDALIRTELSFSDELKYLINLAKTLSLRRYGDSFYIKRTGLKHTYTLQEFVWGHCQNPASANRLYEQLEKIVPDYKTYSLVLSRSNKKVNHTNVYETWEDAALALEENNSFVEYSADTSSLWNDNNEIKLYCVDGDMWHGMLFTSNALANIDSFQVQVSTVDSKGMNWGRVYEWSGSDIVQNCRPLVDEEDKSMEFDEYFIFTPFKHPLILKDITVDVILSVQFYNDNNVDEEEIRPIFGLCSEDFMKWLSDEKFKLELAYGDKYIIDVPEKTIDRST